MKRQGGRQGNRRDTGLLKWASLVICTMLLVVEIRPAAAIAQTYGFRASYENDGSRVLRPFRIWVPPEVSPVLGAVFLWAGAGQDWRDRVGWETFQDAARSLGFALIGTHDNELGLTRAEVDAALRQIMTEAADASGRPELENAPVALMGFSQGGYRSSRAAALSSGRVIGLVGHKGAQMVPLSEEGQQVPAMFIAGEHDGNFVPEFVRQVFQDWRNQGGRAAFAVDWNVGHNDLGNQGWEAAWYWLAEVIRLRYPEGALPSTTPGALIALNDIPLEEGWLGDKARFRSDGTPFITSPFFDIAPYEDFPGSRSAASWVPTEGTAYVYRAFTSTDEIDRDEVPYQTPLLIQTPAAMAAIPADSSIVIEVDPRGFAEGRTIQEVQLYDGSTLLGTASPGTVWTLSYTPEHPGVHALIAVATDDQGERRTTFRTFTALPGDAATSNSPPEDGPGAFLLHPNYPNPFAGSTTIRFDLPRAASVRVDVFDVLGRTVATLLEASLLAGNHAVVFEAKGLASGVYLCRLTADGITRTHAMLLTR